MRESRYNYRFVSHDGVPCVVNGISGTIIVDPGTPLEQVGEPAAHALLRSHHFVVSDETDESDLVRRRNSVVNHQGRALELTLMLHEECNFRCTYCFEDFRNQKLGATRLDEIVAFARERLPRDGVLRIHFYGGEPLLAWSELMLAVAAFEELTADRAALFEFHITTNGSLLSEQRVDYLVRHGVQHIKITLDGPQAVHDARRPRRNGASSYSLVLRGIKLVAGRVRLILRVNVDRDTIGCIPNLLDELEQELSDPAARQSTWIDLNPTYDKGTGDLRQGLGYAEVARAQSSILDRGWRLQTPALARTRYCKFNSDNSYLVDTDGALYLCSQEKDFRVGSVEKLRTSLTVLDQSGVEVRRRFDRQGTSCESCRLLPVCGGGCSLLGHYSGDPPCPPWTEDLETYLGIHHRAQDRNI